MNDTTGAILQNDCKAISPPAPYIGGKRILAKRIVEMLDGISHTTYVEPFVGMGGVFFRRKNVARCEVINDFSKDIATFFRVLQRHPTALTDQLRWQLTSRADFERQQFTDPDRLTDIERAARFFYLQTCSFGGKVVGRSFGISPGMPGKFRTDRLFKRLSDIHKRLQSVTIECLQFQQALARYDRLSTLFYLDPPYWGCENDYGNELFDQRAFELLADQIKCLKGRFVLSINDTPETRLLFDGFEQVPVEIGYSVSQKNWTKAGELLVTNR